MMMARQLFAAVVCAAVLPQGAALAACPQALAVYSDADGTVALEFRPVDETTASTSNLFRMAFAEGPVLDGIVIWNAATSRPDGIVMHQCPQGDATGDEIKACTIWQGIVYAVLPDASVGLLPGQNDAAAEQILLPGFAGALRYSELFGNGINAVPWEVFGLKGCQE